MSHNRLRVRPTPTNRNRSRPHGSRSGGFGLPPQPFRYAVVATLGVGVGLAVISAFSGVASVLTYVGIALFLAIASEPILHFAERRRIPRGVATLLFALLVVLLVAGAVTAVIPTATAQVTETVNSLIDYFAELPNQEWFAWLTATLPAIDLEGLANQAISIVGDPERLLAIGGGLMKVGTGIIDGVTGIIVVTALTIYFIATLPRIKAKAYQFVPLSRRSMIAGLTEEILQSVGRYVGGQLGLASINAIFTFILTSAVGATAPSLLAVIAFVGALIPVVGTVLGATIAVIVTLATGPAAALTVAIVMLVYMQVEAYVLAPRMMAKAVAVPGSIVIVSALAGAALGGILGALVAVPIAAACILIVERVFLPRQQRR